MKWMILLLLLLLTGCSTLEGPYLVTNVIDGDTLDLETGERVRLSGINTPETGECYYQEAKDVLSELVLNQYVYLERDIQNKGKYGRLLRYIYVDGAMVNAYLVSGGYAKVYDKYNETTKYYSELKKLEDYTKGLWVCEDPQAGCLYVASKNSDVYHTPGCKYAKRIKPENLLCFTKKEEIKNLTKSC
jgi:endonuclease YncB( thermonuclease family)